jgi:DNA-binding response OmpR family regulator
LKVKAVLVVDDDTDIRDLIAWQLRAAGYHVVTAADGEAALSAVAAGFVDLVLLDWKLPTMTGIDVCRALRGSPETASLPIVLLTGHAHPTDVTAGFDAGADDYLVKPFSPDELVTRVKSVLGRLGTAS